MALDENIIARWQQSEMLVLGGSAGSFNHILNAVRIFPADLNKTVLIIIHRKKNFLSEIENLFAGNSRMYLREVSDKDVIYKNTIYIAPANYHTLIESKSSFGLDVSEAVWYSKPSIDVSFECAAEVFKTKCTAVLFSGANEDGARGMLSLRTSGALTIAQDPLEAEMPEMPQAAIKLNAAEYILKTDDILDLFKT